MIHAPDVGLVVREESIDTLYWRQHWVGGGRIVPPRLADQQTSPST